MERLVAQVQHFKQWASEYLPAARYGEWECDYPDWVHLYKAVLEFIAIHPSISEWSRMAALWCLNKIDSSHFEPLCLEAELDSRPYLSEYAKKARQKSLSCNTQANQPVASEEI